MNGVLRGGRAWAKGDVYKVLANRVYLGQAMHKGVAYPGEHTAIIDQELWDRAHGVMVEPARQRAATSRAQVPMLLKGLLFGPNGRAMSPSHTTRRGRRNARRRSPHDAPVRDMDAVRQFPVHGNPDQTFASLREPVGNRAAPVVIDADDCRTVARHAGDEAFFHLGVVRHGAVTIEVIFAEIDQNADRRIERGREIDLIGRAFDDVDAPGSRRLQRQNRGADIAAELGV